MQDVSVTLEIHLLSIPDNTVHITGGFQQRTHHRTHSMHEVNNKHGNTWGAQCTVTAKITAEKETAVVDGIGP